MFMLYKLCREEMMRTFHWEDRPGDGYTKRLLGRPEPVAINDTVNGPLCPSSGLLESSGAFDRTLTQAISTHKCFCRGIPFFADAL